MNITKYPLEDGFLTNLSQAWDGATGTMNLNSVPNFTFPAGVTTYLVIEPGTTKMQIAEIDSIDSVAKTVNVSNITIEKGAGINSTALSHPVNSEVIISDNYQFWLDIISSINSKTDSDQDFNWDPATTFGGIVAKSLTTAQRTALTAENGMLVYDTTIGELYQYVGGAWGSVSTGSTQPNASTTVAGKVQEAIDSEITAGTSTGSTGARLFASIAQIMKSISLKASTSVTIDADEFVVNRSGEDKRITQAILRDQLAASTTSKGTTETATDLEAIAGTDELKYVNPKQLKDNTVFGDTITTNSITNSGSVTEYTASKLTSSRSLVSAQLTLNNGNFPASSSGGIQTSPDNVVWTTKISRAYTQSNSQELFGISFVAEKGVYVRGFVSPDDSYIATNVLVIQDLG